MIETRYTTRIDAAHRVAHEERAAAFTSMFRALPKIVSSIRHRA